MNSWDKQLSSLASETALATMIHGGRVAELVCLAATLALPDLLAAGPRPYTELARETATHERSLYRLLRCLAGLGLFREHPQGTFALTDMSRLLTSASPRSLRPFALFAASAPLCPVHNDLLYSIKTGQSAFLHVHGCSFFAYLAEHPELGEIFVANMRSAALRAADALLLQYDFKDAGLVVDVGGGSGALLSEILKAHPGATGLLFDSPSVSETARRCLAEERLPGRCRVAGGDFFQNVPAGGACYLLLHVLHDWEDEDALRILNNCRKAAAENTRLLIIEYLLGEPASHATAALSDISMLILTGGRERSREEYAALLGQAGFSLRCTLLLADGLTLLEAVPLSHWPRH